MKKDGPAGHRAPGIRLSVGAEQTVFAPPSGAADAGAGRVALPARMPRTPSPPVTAVPGAVGSDRYSGQHRDRGAQEVPVGLKQDKLQMGELERMVMGVLWDQRGWLTPGEVHRVLSAKRTLAYTTVMTILVRLWQKGRLERQRDGRAFAYRALQSREEHAATAMAKLLRDVEDRPTALAYFLRSLSAADRAQLRRTLRGQGER